METVNHSMNNPFFQQEEQKVIDQFLAEGFIVFPLEEMRLIHKIKTTVYQLATDILSQETGEWDYFFDKTHELIAKEDLNDFRVRLIAKLAQDKTLRPAIHAMAKNHLGWIVGNELAMQRNCNLSIQLPQDASSLLPLHSDVWSGNSPYEIVFWFPLVSCQQTKSMFILPKSDSEEIFLHLKEYAQLTAEEFYQAIKNRLIWLNVPFGSGVIFSHSLLHGNRINQESETRWSFNVRFKSALSPYGEKEVGESFLPITIRPATRIGYNYRQPDLS